MTSSQRIISFLPSATEMAYALGLSGRLAGVTHECDYPPEVKVKPAIIRPVLPIETMAQADIDAAVSDRLRRGLSLYEVDEILLQQIKPDLILTQNLCQVCAPSGNEVSRVLEILPSKPDILWLTPQSIEGIFANLRELGEATGVAAVAEEVIQRGRTRLDNISAVTVKLSSRPRVFCMEWVDPIFCCGHWVPEMVTIAGGTDQLGREHADSVRIPWNDVVDWAPEILIVMPCGCDLDKAAEEAKRAFAYPGWSKIPAVRNGRVYAVDANSYFARPGPRVIEGTELLAHLIHPDRFAWHGPRAFVNLIEASQPA